jgi:hypothetical protein
MVTVETWRTFSHDSTAPPLSQEGAAERSLLLVNPVLYDSGISRVIQSRVVLGLFSKDY